MNWIFRSVRPWKEKMKERNLCDCEKEIESKSSF